MFRWLIDRDADAVQHSYYNSLIRKHKHFYKLLCKIHTWSPQKKFSRYATVYTRISDSILSIPPHIMVTHCSRDIFKITQCKATLIESSWSRQIVASSQFFNVFWLHNRIRFPCESDQTRCHVILPCDLL